MRYGLTEEVIGKINRVFVAWPMVEQVLLYGSRAKGNYKTGSDLDLAIIGNQVTMTICGHIADQLDELMLPYDIDLICLADIDNPELLQHIDRVGMVFYQR